MTIDKFIYDKIKKYPTLYYYSSFDESKIRVLDHCFLTIGSGEELINGRFNDKIEVSDSDINKIKKGVKLFSIVEVDKDRSKAIGRIVSHRLLGESYFEDDIPEKYKHFKKCLYKISDNNIPDYGYYESPNIADKTKWSPYPFSLWYLPIININPNKIKYDYNTIKDITVDEIRDSIPLMAKDHVEACHYTFSKALDFFEDDSKFLNNRYYNWVSRIDKDFINKWENIPLKQLCEDYNVSLKKYETVEDFVKEIIQIKRNRYISNCKKIIEAYEAY